MGGGADFEVVGERRVMVGGVGRDVGEFDELCLGLAGEALVFII